MTTTTTLVVAAWFAVAARANGAAPCPVFVLARDVDSTRLERREVPNGGSVSLPVGGSAPTIAVVVPVGPGQSGDLVQALRPSSLSVHCAGRVLRVTVHGMSDTRELVTANIDDLAKLDIRVHATSATGTAQRFRIARYARAERESGPVMNLFAGRVRLTPGDIAVTVDTRVVSTVVLRGDAELRFIGGYYVVPGQTSDAHRGFFIVDLAAGTTIIHRDALPSNVATRVASMVEVSERGRRVLDATISGAGGNVAIPPSIATLPSLAIGGIRVNDAEVMVMASLPPFGVDSLLGIIGIDVLRRGGVAAFDVPSAPARIGRLTLGGVTRSGVFESAAMSPVGDLLSVAGSVNDVPADFILDSGSPFTFLAMSLASAANVASTTAGDIPRPSGLDGRPLDVRRGSVDRLRVGPATQTALPVLIADLPVLSKIGANQRVGLLGTSFLNRYERFEVDFDASALRLFSRVQRSVP